MVAGSSPAGGTSPAVPVGGAATGGVDAAIFIQEWAALSPDFTTSFAGPLIALSPVYAAGTLEQVQRFAAPFLADSGAPLAAMAFSEPAGSADFDVDTPGAGTTTTATPDRDHYVVNGTRAWASHLVGWDGDGPDLMTIVCRGPEACRCSWPSANTSPDTSRSKSATTCPASGAA